MRLLALARAASLAVIKFSSKLNWLATLLSSSNRVSELTVGEWPAVFDERYYRSQLATKVTRRGALRHYLDVGETAGHRPHPLFDPVFYLKIRPDVASAGISPLLHYAQSGAGEGVIPIDISSDGVLSLARQMFEFDRRDILAGTVLQTIVFESGAFEDAIALVDSSSVMTLNACLIKSRSLSGLGRHEASLDFVENLRTGEEPKGSLLLASLFGEVAFHANKAGDFTTALKAYEALELIEGASQELPVALRTMRIEYVKNVCQKLGWSRGVLENEKLVAQGKLEHSITAYLTSALLSSQATGDFYLQLMPERSIEKPLLDFCGDLESPTTIQGELRAPAQYLTIVDDCVAYSRCNIVLKGHSAIYDLAMHECGKNAILGDYIFQRERPLIRLRDGGQLLIEDVRDNVLSLPSGLMMFGVGSKNYGHWFLEYLPRMLAYNDARCDLDFPIIVDAGMPPSHYASLNLLNFRKRQIIEIPEGATVEFSRLGMAPVPAYFPFETVGGVYDTVWPKDIFASMRSDLIAEFDKPSLPPRRKLFISRRSFALRKLVNEKAIEDFLLRQGFEIVFPEELTLAEQFLAFASASVVVGSCSSALTNCIFCSHGALVIGLNHGLDFNFNGYASFLSAAGVTLRFVRGETLQLEPGQHPLHANYRIEISRLERALVSPICEK